MKQQASASQAGQQVSDKSPVRTRHFRDLLVWQKSMVLGKAVCLKTAEFPKQEQYGITSQMRRAAVSVRSNIAEGHGRLSDGSLRVFLGQARGSLFELETQIELARDLEYLQTKDAKDLIGAESRSWENAERPHWGAWTLTR
ncbi:MAG TPA: four helix bundle protein [Acidobacteriaceae bacterium]|nr:four helix bundle protein [Acidobacteriaceae bacterium]